MFECSRCKEKNFRFKILHNKKKYVIYSFDLFKAALNWAQDFNDSHEGLLEEEDQIIKISSDDFDAKILHVHAKESRTYSVREEGSQKIYSKTEDFVNNNY